MSRKPTITQRTSIGARILFFVLLSLIVTVGATLYVSVTRYNAFLDQMNLDLAKIALTDLNGFIADFSTKAMQHAEVLSKDRALLEAVSAGDAAELKTLLGDKNASMKLDNITVTDAQGSVLQRLSDPGKAGDSIAGQTGVKSALAGKPSVGFSKDDAAGLVCQASVPLQDKSGKLIGAVVTGYSMQKEDLLDSLKALHGTDFTLFAGDVRLATTILQDNKRVVGTKLAAATAEKVITGNQTYYGEADILGQPYVTSYMPLTGEDQSTVGVLFAGKPISRINAEKSSILVVVLALGLGFLVLTAIVITVLIRRIVSKPMLCLAGYAKQLSVGEVDIDESCSMQATPTEQRAGVRNEIQLLVNAFADMVHSAKKQAEATEQVANGNTGIQLELRSEKDDATRSLIRVIDTLNGLSGEFDQLIKAAGEGNFRLRGQAERFTGEYAYMIEGVNSILDQVVAAMDKVEAAQHISEKQSKYQAAEVDKLVVNLQRLARGKLRCDMEVAPADEDTAEQFQLFSEISTALHSTVDALNSYIRQIAEVLARIADGDLTATIEDEFRGDFRQLKESINTISAVLNDMMTEINGAAGQVASGTGQVSSGAQALSQGATEQASAIEELTASIATIAEQTRQNAVSAGQASALSAEAKESATTGNARMQDMVKSMREIDEASSSISKIIRVIDDIAFQTNLLALNAAVEAARAGQYGKGFAVVAEEVRSLAGRSATAARETTALIESTIQKVEHGTRIANDTADALGGIMSGVEKTSALISGIAAASNEQASAVSQVSTGIEQVAQVVQTTSATAEQSAATSEQLSGQAAYLKQMVGRFRLREKASDDPTHTERSVHALPAGSRAKPSIKLDDGGFGKY